MSKANCNNPVCSQCGGVHANDNNLYWEDGNGGKLCQMCMESAEDQMQWDMAKSSVIFYGDFENASL